jgi:hypothetical protein
VIVFVSRRVGAVIDYRWFKGSGVFDGAPANSRTISIGVAFRLN